MPDAESLREIAQRIISKPVGYHIEELVEGAGVLARAYLDLTVPLTVKCPICEGDPNWARTEHLPSPECPACNGTGRMPHPAVAAARKAFEDAPHLVTCIQAETCGCLECKTRRAKGEQCDCPKAAIGAALEALIALLSAAEARERTLREALEPFARAFDDRWMEGKQIVWRPESLKAYREARAALAASPEK